MQYNEKLCFWKCSQCRGEFWPVEDDVAEQEDDEEKKRYEYILRWGIAKPSAPVLPLVPVWEKGKGNRKAGRKTPKKKKWVPLRTERHLLF